MGRTTYPRKKNTLRKKNITIGGINHSQMGRLWHGFTIFTHITPIFTASWMFYRESSAPIGACHSPRSRSGLSIEMLRKLSLDVEILRCSTKKDQHGSSNMSTGYCPKVSLLFLSFEKHHVLQFIAWNLLELEMLASDGIFINGIRP